MKTANQESEIAAAVDRLASISERLAGFIPRNQNHILNHPNRVKDLIRFADHLARLLECCENEA